MRKKSLLLSVCLLGLLLPLFSQSLEIGNHYYSTTKGLRLRDAQGNGNIIDSLGIYEPVTLLSIGSESTIDSRTASWLEVSTAEGITGWCFGGYISKDSPDRTNMQAFFRLDKEDQQLYSFYSIAGQNKRFYDERVILSYQGKEIRDIGTMYLLNDGETLVFTSKKDDIGELYSYNYKTGSISQIDRSTGLNYEYPTIVCDQFTGSSRFYYTKNALSYVYDCKTGQKYSFDYPNQGYTTYLALYGDYLYGYLTNENGYPAYRKGAQGPSDYDFTLLKYTENKESSQIFHSYSNSVIDIRKIIGQLFNTYLVIEEYHQQNNSAATRKLFLIDTRNGLTTELDADENVMNIWISNGEQFYTWEPVSPGLRIEPDGSWGSSTGPDFAEIYISAYNHDFQKSSTNKFRLPYRGNGPDPRILNQQSWLFNDILYQFFCYNDSGPRHYDCYMIREGEFSHFILDMGTEESREDYLFFPISY